MLPDSAAAFQRPCLSRVLPWVKPLLIAGIFLLLVYNAAGYARFVRFVLQTRYQLNYGEGIVLQHIKLLALHGNCYLDIHAYPLVHVSYLPLFMLAGVPFYALFGPSLFYVRGLSLGCAWLLGAAVYFVSRKKGFSRPLAWMWALVLFVPFFVRYWSCLGRVDMMALFFSTAGLVLFSCSAGRAPGRALAFVFFILGVLTKQTVLTAPLAALGYLLAVREERKHFRYYFLLFTVPLALLLWLGNVWTRGQLYLHLVPYSLAADFSPARMIAGYGEFLALCFPLVFLALAGLLRFRKELTGRADLLFLIYAFLTVLGLSAVGKKGSSWNYYIEPYLGVLLMGVCAMGMIPKANRENFKGRYFEILAFFLILTQLVWNLVIQPVHSRNLKDLNPRFRYSYSIEKQIAAVRYKQSMEALILRTPDPVLSEDVSLLVLNNREVFLEPFQFMYLAKKHFWDPGKLVSDCRQGRFRLILPESRILSIPGMKACLDEAYQEGEEPGGPVFYTPKAPTRAPVP